MNRYDALEAEQALIAAALLDPPHVMAVVGDAVRASDFRSPVNGAVWQAMMDLDLVGHEIDYVTVSGAIAKQQSPPEVPVSYLMDLAELDIIASTAPLYANRIREASLRRQIAEASDELRSACQDEANLPALLQRLHEMHQRFLVDTDGASEPASIRDLLRKLLERFDAAADNQAPDMGVPTGFPSLDHLTRGMRPGRLILLAARTSIGKTAFAANLAASASLRGNGVLLFSAEVDAETISETLFGVSCYANPGRMLRGEPIPEESHGPLMRYASRLADAPLWVDDTPRIDLQTIYARSRRYVEQHAVKLVIVDYLQLLKAPDVGRSGTREQAVSAISRDLVAIARQLNVPVVALAQLGRDTEKEGRKPRLTDLRESGSLEQDAHDIWLLHRPDRMASEGCVIVAKQRNGPLGEFPVHFVGHHQRFMERDDERDRYYDPLPVLDGVAPPSPSTPAPQPDVPEELW